MGVKTTVGQLALMGGGWYDQSANILVDEPGSFLGIGRERGNLYVVLEISGPAIGQDIVAGQLTQAVRRAYQGWRGSITAGLRQAVRTANELLLEENRNSLPGEQRLGGVSCAVLRDDDLFIAQLGPAAVYLLGEGEGTRFPDTSPWLDDIPPEEMDAARLGERHDANVDLFHSKVSLGDTVLMADSEMARCLAAEAWPDILAGNTVVDVLKDLMATSGGRDLSALVVRLGEEAVQQVPLRPKALPEAPVPEAPPDVRGTDVDAAVPLPPVYPGVTELQPEEAPQTEGQPAVEQISTAPPKMHLGQRLQAVVGGLAAVLAGVGAGLLSLVKRMVPDRSAEQRRAEVRTSRSVSTRPGKRQRDKSAAAIRSDPVQKLLVGVAIAIPLIVGIIVLVAWVQRGQAQRGEQEALWQEANAQWQLAQTVSDLSSARTYLSDAQQYLDRFLERQPDYVEGIELKKKIEARLDVINQVQRVSWIGALNSYPSNAELSRVVVQGAHIFVMDRKNGQVYHHRLDEQLQNALRSDSTETVLVRTGEQVGNVLVGDLVDMVWMPTGPGRQRASLVILESGGALLDYDPATGQLLTLQVAATETWQYPKLVGSHSGRFYMLDSTANKILRYDPTADGYSNLPDEWLQTEVDLAGVEDMAIGDSIYLVYADGRISKFSQGLPDPFDISDWDTPPNNPSAIFTRPPEETRWLYVADRGNSRIVQVSKEGSFEQQFLLADTQAVENGDALAEATALFVDEIVGHAYVLSGQKLYLLILPMSE
jgi:hypothetical protein